MAVVPHTALPRIGDSSMNKLIDQTERSLNRIEGHPFANMKVLAPQVFAAPFTNTRVYHGLGYPITGYWIVRATTLAIVTMATTADTDPSNYALFGSSVADTITLVVF